jgi:hypothetical protein
MTSNTNIDKENEKVYVVLRLNKNIARLLRIFANIHADKGSTEDKRINNFLSQEVTKIVHSLAETTPSEEYPDSFKQLIQRYLNEANNNKNNNNQQHGGRS